MDRVALESATPHQTSACAKFLLAGEYSVLIGGPALAIPLTNLKLCYSENSATENSDSEGIFLNDIAIRDPENLQKFWQLRNLMSPNTSPLSVRIHTQIPIGKGLGSSAALCVAMARFFNPKASNLEIAEVALAGEKIFHGNPSGVDPYCVSLEQPIEFRRSPRFHQPLAMQSLQESGYVFFLRDSGGHHHTKNLVESLMVHKNIIGTLQDDAENMKQAVAEDASKIARLMQSIQKKFRELGASSEAIEKNIAELYELGALGAKITGSGRGGFVLSIFSQKAAAKLPSSVKDCGFFWPMI